MLSSAEKETWQGISPEKEIVVVFTKAIYFNSHSCVCCQYRQAMTLLLDVKKLWLMNAQTGWQWLGRLPLHFQPTFIPACCAAATIWTKGKHKVGLGGRVFSSCREKRNSRWLLELTFIIRNSFEPKLHPDCSDFLNLH